MYFVDKRLSEIVWHVSQIYSPTYTCANHEEKGKLKDLDGGKIDRQRQPGYIINEYV